MRLESIYCWKTEIKRINDFWVHSPASNIFTTRICILHWCQSPWTEAKSPSSSLSMVALIHTLTSIHQCNIKPLMCKKQEQQLQVQLQAQERDWKVLRYCSSSSSNHRRHTPCHAYHWALWVCCKSIDFGNLGVSSPPIAVSVRGGPTHSPAGLYYQPAGVSRLKVGNPAMAQLHLSTASSAVSLTDTGWAQPPLFICLAAPWHLLMVVTAEEHNANRIIDMVVLEQLITWLPEGTVEWIQCYHPASLDEAIQLAEDHLVVFSGAGEHLALSFSLYLPCLPFFVLPSLPPFCA